MTRLARLVLLFGVMVAAATASSTASAASWKSCGDVAATQEIRAFALNCSSARALAERHSDTSIPGGACDLSRNRCRIDAFVCKRKFFGNSGTKIRCSFGKRQVRFFYGT
jgi:hypothetical protein